MKDLKIILIAENEILDIKVNKYDTEHYRGEGFALEIHTENRYKETVGGVISSTLVAIEDNNLSGRAAKLTEYEKVILVTRAYCNPDFSPDENREILIVTNNYNNLMNRNASISEVKEEIKKKLFMYFRERPTQFIDGISLYCSLHYDISVIRKSLLLLKEIGDIEVKASAGTWDNRNIEHWYQQYKLNPKIFKEIEAKSGQEQSKLQNKKDLVSTESDEFDFFICHASEDKVLFVRELANKLKDESFNIWYDEFSLSWGDSLRQSIEKGLKESKHGIVVLSHNFFAKDWPQKELDGLFELESENKKILPIWFRIDRDAIGGYSPILAGRLALKAEDGYDRIIDEAKKLLGRNSKP